MHNRYLWGPAVDELLAEETVDNGGAEDVLWALTDHQNTVRDLAQYNPGTDTTTVVNHLKYDAFGNVTAESNPAVDSLFLYTARSFDTDTGLQNNLNRWYDVRTGKWLSEDPIGFSAGDGNLVRYVGNRVMMGTDPLGAYIMTRVLPLAGGCAAADGPAIIGDVIGIGMIVGAACIDVPGMIADACSKAEAKAEVKAKAERECIGLHDKYEDLKNKAREKYKDEDNPEWLIAMCEAINRELQLRIQYMEKKCDYVLEPRFGDGEEQEQKHIDAIQQVTIALHDCYERLRNLPKQRKGRR